MGYTTSFKGQFTCTPPLSPAHREYLLDFAAMRHEKLDPAEAEAIDPPGSSRRLVGLPIGEDGAYFVMPHGGSCCHEAPTSVKVKVGKGNRPPGQPGYYCQWVPTDDGTAIEWDQGEKFYDYSEWLKYILEHFLIPWGYKLSGDVEWTGECDDDRGTIRVENGIVLVAELERVTPPPEAFKPLEFKAM